MGMDETTYHFGDLALAVSQDRADDSVRVRFRVDGDAPAPEPTLQLHWGLCRRPGDRWRAPPRASWPEGSEPAREAVRTPFRAGGGGTAELELTLRPGEEARFLAFVLFVPPARWLRTPEGDGYLRLARPASEADARGRLREALAHEETCSNASFKLGEQGSVVAALVRASDSSCTRALFLTDVREPALLHWGLEIDEPGHWAELPASFHPAGAERFDSRARRNAFQATPDGLQRLMLDLGPDMGARARALSFVLYLPATRSWLKDRGRNCQLPLRSYLAASGGPRPELPALIEEIARHELGKASWTLMHRFQLCTRLLERVAGDPDAVALLFVWLRFSALRQLDWQRRYNTKPRELAHALDRLTAAIVTLYREAPPLRDLLRLMLAALGRGVDGQRVRDQILEIMHRHKIKEVANHFMEEWHQKLHNNTTPDDIAICEAYLAFLRSDGDLERFWLALEERGVTRSRLESYDRPIKTAPDFVPRLKDALIGEFEDYLHTLKLVHEGADLRVAAEAAAPLLPPRARGALAALLRLSTSRRAAGDAPAGADDAEETTREAEVAPEEVQTGAFLAQIADLRRQVLRLALEVAQDARELLYLDIALENAVRARVEQTIHLERGTTELFEELTALIEHAALSAGEGDELQLVLAHWRRLLATAPSEAERRDWFRHAHAVLDRLRRVLAEDVDRLYEALQPKANELGRALELEAWAISLFSEEVVRGRPVFALALLLKKAEALARRAARLADWQVISRGEGQGMLEQVQSLREVQGKRFARPTVLLAKHVGGDEEVPEGVTAVITEDAPDLVSHIAVRARNEGVLFASCFAEEALVQLRALHGQFVRLELTGSGDVTFALGAADRPTSDGAPRREARPNPGRARPTPTGSFALSASEFDDARVGQKSLNLARLAASLPDWVQVPASVAIPFGVLERTLGSPDNRALAATYARLTDQLAGDDSDIRRRLGELRALVPQLRPPEGFFAALERALRTAHLSWPQNEGRVWQCVTAVWASRWNDRAFFSHRARGLSPGEVDMAVLIQAVVRADYAFVIHTVNPAGEQRDALFAEVVVGLGETLVGNFPGRPLSFVWHKAAAEREALELLTFPSKGVALTCPRDTLIFRSDSSAEDLAGYAGAGLHDSVMLEPAAHELVDYSRARLLWDGRDRHEVLGGVARLGLEIEQLTGAPQDIEGVVRGDTYHVVQARPQVGLRAS